MEDRAAEAAAMLNNAIMEAGGSEVARFGRDLVGLVRDGHLDVEVNSV